MEKMFNKLQFDICESLNSREIPKSKLVACLMGFNTLKHVYQGPNDSIFRKQRRKLQESSSITDVWCIIADYFSFFNYELIEQIVDNVGTTEDQEKIREYEQHLVKYAQKRIFECKLSIPSTPSNDYSELIIKLDSTYDNCQAYYLKLFEKRLINILNLRPGVLCLLSVEEGCIQLRYISPACLEETVFPLSSSQESELKKLDIIRLQCGQYTYPTNYDDAASSDSENNDSDGDNDDDNRSALSTANIRSQNVPQELEVLSADYFKKSVPSSDSGIFSWKSKQSAVQSWKSAQEEVCSILKFQTFNDFLITTKEFESVAEAKKIDSVDETVNHGVLVACHNGEVHKLKFHFEVLGFKCNARSASALLATAILSDNNIMIEWILQYIQIDCWFGLFLAAFYGNFHLMKQILKKEPGIIYHFKSQLASFNPIVASCVNGDSQILKYLLTECAKFFDIESIIAPKNVSFKIPLKLLDIATLCNNFEIVKFLVETYDLNPFESDEEAQSSVHGAILFGSFQILKYFVSLDCFDGDFSRLFITSIWYGCVDVFQFLVEEMKCDPRTQDSAGFDCLQHSIVASSTEIVIYLLSTFEGLGKKQDIFGWNVFHLAAYAGDLDIFKAVASYNLPSLMISQRNYDDCTPLHLAAANGHLNIVKFMVEELRVESNIPNQLGCTPLHYAVQAGKVDIVKYLLLFLTNSQLQSHKDVSGVTPLIYGIYDLQVLKVLINELNFNPMNPVDENERLLLHYACNKGTLSVVKFLVDDCHCDPTAPDSENLLPLHYAVLGGKLDTVKYLMIEKKCDVECRNPEGYTPLHIACERGDEKLVRFLTSSLVNCNTNATTKYGTTPLHIASRCGHSEIVRYLVDSAKCDLSAVDNDGKSSVHYAVFSNKTSVVKFLTVERHLVCVEDKDIFGLTPLHFAILIGSQQIISLLLNFAHCDPNCTAMYGKKPIHLACFKGKLSAVRSLLAKSNCVYDQQAAADSVGKTPLHYAVASGNTKLVKFLVLEKKSDVLWGDINGRTPLHTAILYENMEIVNCFLDVAGRDVSKCVDTLGETLLHWTCLKGNTVLAEALIKKYGCDPRKKDLNSRLPLHYAIESGSLETVKFLIFDQGLTLTSTKSCQYEFEPLLLAAIHGHLDIIKFGIVSLNCSPNLINSRTGEQLIHFACQFGHNDIVVFLLQDCECSVSVRTNDNSTPLHYAARGGHVETIKLLVQHSCDPMCMNDNNLTPLHIASFEGHLSVVKYMIEVLGCDPNIPNKYGRFPLHAACANEKLEVMEYFFKNNICDKLARDILGNTPLHLAAEYGKMQSVKFFAEDFACEVTELNIDGMTPLHLAAYNGHSHIVSYLVDKFNSNPLYLNRDNLTPIDMAIKNGHTNIAKFLREAATKLNSKPVKCDLSHFWSSIRYAVDVGFVVNLRKLYEHDVNIVNYVKRSPLHCAAIMGKFGAVVHLLQHGANPLQRDLYKNLPLHYASQQGNAHIVRVLVKAGCNSSTPGYANQTPLQRAIDAQQQDVVEYLCSIEEKNLTGEFQHQDQASNTFLLHKAAREGSIQQLKELVNVNMLGVNEVDSTGRTPLHYAAMFGHLVIARFLIISNANPFPSDIFQNLPIHYAAANDQLSVVQLLIDSGSPFDTRGEIATNDDTVVLMTPVEMADCRGSIAVHEYLSQLQGSGTQHGQLQGPVHAAEVQLHHDQNQNRAAVTCSYCLLFTFLFTMVSPLFVFILFRKFRGRL